jgi:hypothetical protein
MIPLAAILSIGEKVLDRVMPDPQAKAEAQAKLMEMAQKGELAQLEADVKKMEIEMKDRDSARGRESAMAAADVHPITKNINSILSLGVITLSFILFAILIFIDVKPAAKDILIYILGVLSAAVTQILSYYFGSSAGSKEKSKQLDDLLEKK